MPPRLSPSVLAALGLASSAWVCGGKEQAHPCLSMPPEQPQPPIHPCLSPPVEPPQPPTEPPVGPCLEYAEPPLAPCLSQTPPEPPVGPCLDVPAPPPDPPEPPIGPCLSPPPPDRPDGRTDRPKTAPPAREVVLDKVLDKGVLPEDVARKLRDRRR